jgi:HEAT repeat protein
MTFPSRRLVMVAFVVVGLAAAALAIHGQRSKLWAWYYAAQFASADQESASKWLNKAVESGPDVFTRFLNSLALTDESACLKLTTSMATIGATTGDDRVVSTVLCELASRYPELPESVHARALEFARDLLQRPGVSAELVSNVAALAQASAKSPSLSTRRLILDIAPLLARGKPAAELQDSARDLVRRGLTAGEPDVRRSFVHLACHPQIDLLTAVVPLLRDPSAEVRHAAVLAVGGAVDQVATDDLLPTLHDADPLVCRACQLALQGRGLSDSQIRLGKLLTAPDVSSRLGIIDRLRTEADIDATAWLRRLSHDVHPAVRAAALRAAAELPHTKMADRMEQISQNDASDTVRQIATYYLGQRRDGR